MSVILPQYLAAVLLYLRDPKRFTVRAFEADNDREIPIRSSPDIVLEPQRAVAEEDETCKPFDRQFMSKDVQEAILLLNEARDIPQLNSAIKQAAILVLSEVTEVLLYFQEDAGGGLISFDHLVHSFPTTGVAAEALAERQLVYAKNGLDDSDPLAGLLPTGVCPIDDGKTVVCCPVINSDDDSVIAVLVAVCDLLSPEEEQRLTFLAKLISSAYYHLKFSNNNMAETRTEDILQLCGDLHDEDAESLQLKVIRYLEKHTASQIAFLLLVSPSAGELFCQVIGDKILPEELRFPASRNCFSSVLIKKRPVSRNDISQEQFEELQSIVGIEVDSLLCIPVMRQTSGNIVALACLINKQTPDHRYTKADVDTVHHCFKYTTTVLTSTLAFQNERKLKNQTEALLQVAKNLFTHLDDLTNLLREIMQEARNLTKAERCSVFLVDEESEELVAKVFDGSIHDTLDSEIRIPMTQGVAGHVITTGEILNIHDAYSHPLFYRGVDDTTGFKTRNILCFPIKDEKENTVGVAQLCNKRDGKNFTTFDEDIAKAFSIYCCISIVHSLMYRTVNEASTRSRLCNELMIYHMQVNEEDVTKLAKCHIPPPKSFDPLIDKFLFTPRGIPEAETPLVIVSMMDEMGFINRYRIKRDTLAKFTLMVRKGYRDPPYHNWMHAVSVTHFCYLLHANVDLSLYLSDLEVLALFVACMCHDIDHRGTNNAFQVTSQSILAALYSSEGSVMERHHFAQTMCILNTEGCNIFENLNRKEYEEVLDLIRDIILATDIAQHLRIFTKLRAMIDEGYDKENDKHRELLLSLLMTSSDLCDQTKPWKNATKIAEMIYQEFFSQGDLEKALGRNPSEMMDRDKAYIPNLQIDFLDKIALPVYELLSDMFPQAKEVVLAVRNNKRKWCDVNENLVKRKLSLSGSLEIFNALADHESKTHNGENST